jgi:hypothetical protein
LGTGAGNPPALCRPHQGEAGAIFYSASLKKFQKFQALVIQSFQRFWGMGELSIHRWKGFELYPVINKKTVNKMIIQLQGTSIY